MISMHFRRAGFWYWDSAILVQTLALTAALVLATSLNAFYQLTIMLLIMIVGFGALTHAQPFKASLSQSMQVGICPPLRQSQKARTGHHREGAVLQSYLRKACEMTMP